MLEHYWMARPEMTAAFDRLLLVLQVANIDLKEFVEAAERRPNELKRVMERPNRAYNRAYMKDYRKGLRRRDG